MMKEYWPALFGGMLIGSAAVMMFWFNGRIMGISGICSRLLGKPSQDSMWRIVFVLGLGVGAWIYQSFSGTSIIIDASTVTVIFAGLLVGFGTVLGNGCTSGHGVCGMARLSRRSIAATMVFILAGMIVVWLKRVTGV